MRPSLRPVALVATLALATLLRQPSRAHGQDKPAPLARYFPAKDLIAYAEFDGFDAHGAAWKKTATYKLLTETTTGAMLEAIATQAIETLLASAPPADKAPTAEEIAATARHLVQSGFAFGVSGKPNDPKSLSLGFVIRGGAKGKVRELVGRMIDADKGPDQKITTVAKPGNRRVSVVANAEGSGYAWWSEKDDLAFCIMLAKNADAMIDALDGRAPSAAADPARNALAKVQDGFEPVGLAFFDMAGLPKLPPQFASLGLDKIKRVDYRWGFQGDALVTITRIVAPAPRTGIAALLDQPTFDAKTLPPVPASADEFTVFTLDLERSYDRIAGLAEAANPEVRAQFFALEDGFFNLTGRPLRADVLRHLGPKFAYYTIPVRGNLPSNPISGIASSLLRVPKTVTLIEIRDAAGFAPVLDALVIKANDAIRTAIGGDRERGKAFGFIVLKGDVKGWTLVLPPTVVPFAAGARPTFLLGKNYLVCGTTPDVARKALALEGKPNALADGPLAKAVARMPGNLTFVGISDTRESLLPEIIANLPALLAAIPTYERSKPEMPIAAIAQPDPVRVQYDPAKVGGPLRLMIGPDMVPDPDAIRPYLFPAMYAISVDDQGISFLSRESVPGLNPTTAAPIAAALFLPAIGASRAAARRAQSTNNLKQIGLAMHNYEAANGHLPCTVRDKDGKPLLSWRVQLLPYMEDAALYNEFKLDEPWDSPHNKPLLAKMPMSFVVPSSVPMESGMTHYRGFAGAGTLFDPDVKEGVKIADILDGTSNTIGVVEAREAVEWTKPDSDLAFDNKDEAAKALLAKLGGHFPGGFNALFMDGSVRFIKESVASMVLRALITRNGGEVIANDSF